MKVNNSPEKSRRVTLGLFVLFLTPWVLASVCYYGSVTAWLKPKTNGVLLETPINIRDLNLGWVAEPRAADLKDKWLVLYRWPARCEAACQESQHLLQNAVIALGKDQQRVRLLAVRDNPSLPFLTEGAVALVDPLGWLMLYYTPAIPYKGVLTDLRRLLKFSRIG